MNNSALVVKYAEIHLKGLNRPFFERKLVEKIEEALSDARPRVVREQGRIFVYELPEEHLEEYGSRRSSVSIPYPSPPAGRRPGRRCEPWESASWRPIGTSPRPSRCLPAGRTSGFP